MKSVCFRNSASPRLCWRWCHLKSHNSWLLYRRESQGSLVCFFDVWAFSKHARLPWEKENTFWLLRIFQGTHLTNRKNDDMVRMTTTNDNSFLSLLFCAVDILFQPPHLNVSHQTPKASRENVGVFKPNKDFFRSFIDDPFRMGQAGRLTLGEGPGPFWMKKGFVKEENKGSACSLDFLYTSSASCGNFLVPVDGFMIRFRMLKTQSHISLHIIGVSETLFALHPMVLKCVGCCFFWLTMYFFECPVSQHLHRFGTMPQQGSQSLPRGLVRRSVEVTWHNKLREVHAKSEGKYILFFVPRDPWCFALGPGKRLPCLEWRRGHGRHAHQCVGLLVALCVAALVGRLRQLVFGSEDSWQVLFCKSCFCVRWGWWGSLDFIIWFRSRRR